MSRLTNNLALSNSLVVAVLLVFVTLSPVIKADIYKVTNADGSVIYTDQPPDDADNASVELLKPTTTNRVPGLNIRNPEAVPTDTIDAKPEQKSVTIVSPQDQTTIPMGAGHFTVTADVSPELAPDESLELMMDGEPVGEATANPVWDLRFVIRGEHKLEVSRLDGGGNITATSDVITVYVLRPSVR